MDIRVKASCEAAALDLADHVRHRLLSTLAHRRAEVERVDVRLSDGGCVGAPRDAYCLIQLKLSGTTAACVVAMANDPYRAIEGAAERVGRMADEQLLATAVDRRREPAAATPA